MLIDFKEVKRVLGPLVDAFDHATLVAESDEELLGVVEATGWKHYVLPFDSTSENLCAYVIDYLGREGGETLREHGVTRIRVRLEETETCYAELERTISAYAPSREEEKAGEPELLASTA
jgi:6-pyruvoyltetrahydropterin/6-carboxytetrahydropterin synthase